MANMKVDVKRLDTIVKNAVEAINVSKNELYDIAESARKECKKLEDEFADLKRQVNELISKVEILEDELKESKRKLFLTNKNFEKHSQKDLRLAYEKADNLRMELTRKREQEQYLIKRRNEIEIRIKEAYETVRKADSLIASVGAALGYLTGDLQELSQQLEDIQERQQMGLKIIKAQEEERQRVARDIHDGPAQSMSNVVLKAELCERLIDVDSNKAKEELRGLKKIVRESLQDVRRIIYNLRPMSLDDLGLVPTIQRYVETFEDETGISVSFKSRGIFDEIKPAISLTVFRIVQESLNNIKKHANAKNTIVNLEFMEKNLKLRIHDDGNGFKPEDLKRESENISKGFGLYSMRERVELLDGELNLTSELGKGTSVGVSIPLS